jgi:nucleoside-diphosphate-sugar epimerase
MILGSGLLGAGLKASGLDFDKHLIFASGVSNSGCFSANEFSREIELLTRTLRQKPDGQRMVYFSTLSLEGKPTAKSHYLEHKRQAEQLVLAGGGLVVRLPLIHGRGGSPHTLINFFLNQIQNGATLRIQEQARRNVISVNDLSVLLHRFLERTNSSSQIVRFSSRFDFFPLELAMQLRDHFKSSSKLEIVPGGYEYPNYFEDSKALASDLDMSRLQDYAIKVALTGREL